MLYILVHAVHLFRRVLHSGAPASWMQYPVTAQQGVVTALIGCVSVALKMNSDELVGCSDVVRILDRWRDGGSFLGLNVSGAMCYDHSIVVAAERYVLGLLDFRTHIDRPELTALLRELHRDAHRLDAMWRATPATTSTREKKRPYGGEMATKRGPPFVALCTKLMSAVVGSA